MQLKYLEISISEQLLRGFENLPTNHSASSEQTDLGKAIVQYSISTAKNGVGQLNGSECTPLGSHRIRARIGGGAQYASVFTGRRPTGEIHSDSLEKAFPDRDWILSRILWLCGNQVGFNRGGKVDTQRRYVYIHGAPDSHDMGVPSSHGCIKMRNSDIISLFEKVTVGSIVHIKE